MRDDSRSKTDGRRHSLLDGWSSPPNIVTYARIALVIVFIIVDIQAGPWGERGVGRRWAATILFIVAASTDKLDGYLARKYNQVTELGKLMDPIADKLLICSALVVASVFGEIWWLVTALFLIRELGITIMRFFVIDAGGQVIAASQVGKFKTLFECVGLALLLAPLGRLGVWYVISARGVILLALALCLYSGFEYVHGVLTGGRR
ncbi:CDP-diacylglycerol--glycerol-3-phosphate 3-phosphatidyltransferase [Bifidobacterium actinocoloniiforme DSM 22766]|uniref:CDP-diacylglycerol--glycerol-3-phosphate 3-phosphatidyltransferase n=1 Tax=Bifidobacterium actinocoloniiforme DSM 22766 TaxID=1437605 RepID=A0A086Z0U4_9BIFI|nr:CDP-diacylglycerol--glycerol-3-phosphate 3-phosphatidyltransferase [Bifidobacterium actinocoloniiforme]AKV55339.1 CDP-diacylglycerol--glycerol-3-phosphate 3-phosphatidyltransferase [Bifidobacterium actinocoloniiforme DSM 22766]KFI40144.1 CDP-diacylglycerol--glycerol-3-phosphate 3-phosphatidyltransferase [Bifidobacterium actinocoloniiforme DSM 22766]